MKVILKSEVDNVGLPGDVVDVADGFGRNFLLPRGKAIRATPGAMKQAEALMRSRKAAEAKTLGAAEAAKQALESRTLRVPVRVDDRGSLYGSVGVNDVQRVLKERGHDIPRKRIEMRGTIKEIGVYEVPVQVHPQVTATVEVHVVDEEGRITLGGLADEEAESRAAQAEQAAEATESPDGESGVPADTEAAGGGSTPGDAEASVDDEPAQG